MNEFFGGMVFATLLLYYIPRLFDLVKVVEKK